MLFEDRVTDFSLKLAVVLAFAYLGMFLYIAFSHVWFPFEIEWFEGIMYDHVLRIVQHLPVYTRPSPTFAATLYQPFFYYVSRAVMVVSGNNFAALRIVSVLSTL